MSSSTSIEYFRKQAKALHRSVAAGDAEALRRFEKYRKDSDRRRLTHCQHVIACEHQFSNWENLVHAGDIERRFAITMDREPVLNHHGVGISQEYFRSPADVRQRVLQKERQEFRKSADAVKRTYEWLLVNLPPARSLRRPVSSYRLKHVAEDDIGYITNGVFIAAALIAGYPYRFYDEPNLHFGVSIKALRANEERQRQERIDLVRRKRG